MCEQSIKKKKKKKKKKKAIFTSLQFSAQTQINFKCDLQPVICQHGYIMI